MKSRKIQIVSIGAFLFVALCIYYFLSVHFQETKYEAKLTKIKQDIHLGMPVNDVRIYLQSNSINYD